MYIFEGGAGFSGICKKVEPGDDIKCSNGVNVTESKIKTSQLDEGGTVKFEVNHTTCSQSDRYLLSFGLCYYISNIPMMT